MTKLLIGDLLDRVLSTEIRVPFTAADPYGHLATGRYVDLFVDHRFEGFDRHIGVNWVSIAREHGGGYFISDLQLRFLRPILATSQITLGSWITNIGKKNVSIRGVFVGSNGAAHALAKIEMIAVDTKTGRAIDHPEMPAREGAGAPTALPTSAEFLARVTGMPPE